MAEILITRIARLDFGDADEAQMKSHISLQLNLHDATVDTHLAESDIARFRPVIKTTLRTNYIVSFCSCR